MTTYEKIRKAIVELEDIEKNILDQVGPGVSSYCVGVELTDNDVDGLSYALNLLHDAMKEVPHCG